MTKLSLQTLLITLVILVISTQVSAQGLTICAKVEGHPKHYLDSSGRPQGYAIEIAAEAVRRAGYTPQVVNVPWKRAQQMALIGRCVITAFSVTEKRKANYLFSIPMYIDRVLLWQSVDRKFSFTQFEDLIGKLIGIPVASHYSGEFDRIRPRLRLYEDMDRQASLMMLLRGRLDAAIFPGDVATVKYIAHKQGLDFSKLTPARKPISLDPNHIGVPKELIGFSSETVLKKLNASLAAMKADGRIKSILDRYQ